MKVYKVHKVESKINKVFKVILTLGTFYFMNFSLVSAQQHEIDSLSAVIKTGKEDSNKVTTLNQLSQSFNRIAEYKKADSAAFLALHLAQQLNYKPGESFAYINIGLDFFRRGDYPDALENYLQAMKSAEESGDKKSMGLAYHRIGNAYDVLGEYAKAIDYFTKALIVRRKIGDEAGEAHTLNGIGEVHRNKKEYDSALVYYFKALTLNQKIKNDQQASYNLGNIGLSYHGLGNYTLALEYEFKAVKMCEALGDKENISEVLNDAGLVYLEQANYKDALLNENKSLDLAKEIGAKDDIKEAYRALSEIYEKKGDVKEEMEYYKMYIAQRDSIFNRQNAEQIAGNELKYQFDKQKTAEDAEQEKKEVLQQEQLHKQQLVLYFVCGGLLLVIAFALFISRSLQVSRKKTAIIEKQKEEMERLSVVARETDNIVLIMDAEGRVEWANESFTRINGITIEEVKRLKGETIFEISNNPDIRKLVDEAIRSKKSVVYESLNRNKSGQATWESSTLTPIFNENGKLHKLVIVDTDVTERKHAEEIIREKNKDITDSINYAKRIQNTMLPTVEDIRKYLFDSFVLYKPKDIVSGDFYYYSAPTGKSKKAIICAADCTGHGVPGAFMSMVGIDLLNHIIVEKGIETPGLILAELHDGIRVALKQNTANSTTFDGMDISVCAIDLQTGEIEYAGALRNLYIIRENKLLDEIKADKQSIGGINSYVKKVFTNHTVQLNKGDSIYLASDGYSDQFGGDKNKKVTTKKFKDLLLSICSKPMKEQEVLLNDFIENWKGKLEQVDDILVIGIRI